MACSLVTQTKRATCLMSPCDCFMLVACGGCITGKATQGLAASSPRKLRFTGGLTEVGDEPHPRLDVSMETLTCSLASRQRLVLHVQEGPFPSRRGRCGGSRHFGAAVLGHVRKII